MLQRCIFQCSLLLVNQCKSFVVSGRVQGVFYRASTHEAASALGLTGWVRNRDDGKVELLACGETEALLSLEKWLWHGPAHALVDEVDISDVKTADFSDFSVSY